MKYTILDNKSHTYGLFFTVWEISCYIGYISSMGILMHMKNLIYINCSVWYVCTCVLHQFYTSDDETMTRPHNFNTQHKNNQHLIFQCHAMTFTFFTYFVTQIIVGV